MQLITPRLILRPLEEADFPAYEKTLNEVQRTFFGSGEAFFRWVLSQYEAMDIVNGAVSLGIFDRETGALLGTAGAGKHDDLHESEIFYHLLPQFQGQGFATEAAKAVTQWALGNYDIPYLIGTVGVDNPKSQRVLERCGYQFIGERTLLVHAVGERYRFKYYRCYPTPPEQSTAVR